MEALKTGWDFFQNEILGMAWLNRLIESLLTRWDWIRPRESAAAYSSFCMTSSKSWCCSAF